MNLIENLYTVNVVHFLNLYLICVTYSKIGCSALHRHEFIVSLDLGMKKNHNILSEDRKSNNVENFDATLDRSNFKKNSASYRGDILKDLGDISPKNVYELKHDLWLTTSTPTPSHESDSRKIQTYVKPTCYINEGKIVCSLGRFQYVLNVGDMEIPDDVLQTFVALIYRRVQEGDKCFDISIVKPATTICMMKHTTAPEIVSTEDPDLMTPVTIVCNPIKRKKPYTCGTREEEPLETLFKCEWKTNKIGFHSN